MARFGEEAVDATAKLIGMGVPFTEIPAQPPSIIVRAKPGVLVVDITNDERGFDNPFFSIMLTPDAANELAENLLVSSLAASGGGPADLADNPRARAIMEKGIAKAKEGVTQ